MVLNQAGTILVLGGEAGLFAVSALLGLPSLLMLIPLAPRLKTPEMPSEDGGGVSRRALWHSVSHSGLFFVYMACIVILTLTLSFTGLDIVTAFSAVVACINNTGPGLGLVGPATNYAVLEDFQTWVCIFAMLLGRLEIFTLLVVLTPAFWRK